jgi:methylphosphotriester-DNA--protein-cysteine methyltransferase
MQAGLNKGDRWGSTARVMLRREPHPRLAAYVRSIIVLDRIGQEADEIYVLPDDQATLIFSINAGRRLTAAGAFAGAQTDLVLLGPPTRSYARRVAGVPVTIVVTFTPTGARLISRTSMSELRDQRVDPTGFLGQPGRRLRVALGAMATHHERLDALEGFLLQRLEDCTSRELRAARLVYDVVGELQRREFIGTTPTSSPDADALPGKSTRQLRRLFKTVIGLNPHAVLRIERFHRALNLARAECPPRWAHIAALCGYYDQAHMIADFQAMTSASPCQLMRLLGFGMSHVRGCWFEQFPGSV